MALNFPNIRFMEDANNSWLVLTEKYANGVITPEEMQELERQAASSPILARQLREIKDPEAFLNRLRTAYAIDTESGLQRVRAAVASLQKPVPAPIYKRFLAKLQALGKRMRQHPLELAAALVVTCIIAIAITILSGSSLPIKNHSYVITPDKKEHNLDTAPDGAIIYASETAKITYADNRLVIESTSKNTNGNDDETFAVVTAPGKQVEVVLPEMTRVQLNAASYIKVPLEFEQQIRKVSLSGEGFFEVSPIDHVPFIVSSKTMDVTAEGTSFNVRDYKGENPVTTLISGKIKINTGSQEKTLSGRQQVELADRKTIRLIPHPNIESSIAWVNNQFYFQNIGIKEMIKEVGRWYGYKVEFRGNDNEYKEKRASGKFMRSLNIDSLLMGLSRINNISAKTEGEKIIVYPK